MDSWLKQKLKEFDDKRTEYMCRIAARLAVYNFFKANPNVGR